MAMFLFNSACRTQVRLKDVQMTSTYENIAGDEAYIWICVTSKDTQTRYDNIEDRDKDYDRLLEALNA